MSYLINALLAINVIVCLLIILLVLMQRPRNEGLGAAFGGGMTEGLFGAQTTHVLAKVTRWLGGLFFALTLGLGILYSRNFGRTQSELEKKLSTAPVPAATPAPATPAPAAVPDGGIVPTPETPAPGTPAPAPGTPATPDGGIVPTPATPAPAAPPATPAPATPEAPAAPAPATPATPAPAPK